MNRRSVQSVCARRRQEIRFAKSFQFLAGDKKQAMSACGVSIEPFQTVSVSAICILHHLDKRGLNDEDRW
jgi:hypothetical protein